ncbi:MAG TPA: AAA family ATPase, partial [Solirubrobacteraceae bacterium]|nr:AAA family ATPase [Solirubrobacteraceae bacterium]
MTDNPESPKPPTGAGSDEPPASSNGFSRNKASVRSGFAEHRNPVLVGLGEFVSNTRRTVSRDPLSLFLLLASVGLAITFALLLGSIKPKSSGMEVPISTVQQLAKHRQITSAVLLDHDDRVVLTTNATTHVEADGTIVAPPTPAESASKSAKTTKTAKATKAAAASTATGASAPGATATTGGTTTGVTATGASATGATPAAATAAGAATTGATATGATATGTKATGAIAGNQTLWAAYPASGAQTQQLLAELNATGATVTVDQQSFKATETIIVQFLIPILLLVCLFSLFTRLGGDNAAGGIAAFSQFTGKGRKKGKGTTDKVTFADIAGAGEALAELREIRDYLADPSKYLEVGAAAPKGVLLVGPPGTGKTLLAKAVAGEADAAFFSLSGSDFVESLVGVGAARVRDLFRKARKVSPAIIFIDELDAAGRKRGAGIGQGNDEREQTLNQILVEMDGFSGDGGLVVMGATNRPDILDPALLRPGRFDRQVVVDVPDVHGRVEILRLHGGKRPMAPDASLEEVARQTPGFSGAELANVINEAALLTVRQGSKTIDQAELEEAIDRVVAGPARPHMLTREERWLIAVHESSHAVVTEAIGQATAHRKLSIVAR